MVEEIEKEIRTHGAQNYAQEFPPLLFHSNLMKARIRHKKIRIEPTKPDMLFWSIITLCDPVQFTDGCERTVHRHQANGNSEERVRYIYGGGGDFAAIATATHTSPTC